MMALSGFINLLKPPGMSSHDVVGFVRKVLQEKRVGHAGTLDPAAAGVLPVAVGQAARLIEYLEITDKAYRAEIRLGISTDSGDDTGEVLARQAFEMPAPAAVETALAKFRGPILQVPPAHSAIKIRGRKACDLLRQGEQVAIPPRGVTIYKLELLSFWQQGFRLEVECSKGTYIRTLCHDIGQALGCGGAMSSLRRVSCGRFGIAQAHTLDEILLRKEQGRERELLLPVDSLFSELPEAVIGPAEEKKCRCGTEFPTALPEGRYRVYAESGEFLMLGSAEEGRMKTVKNFFEV